MLLKVNDISCEHCVKAITEAVNTLSGIFNVKVDLQAKTVTVEYNSALITAKAIGDKIVEQGYDICTE
ncbi:MAG: copper ion binding protein [Nitrososphaerota archaeon]|nr:copper ion binding protein [Nitrososphaerota archaeon]